MKPIKLIFVIVLLLLVACSTPPPTTPPERSAPIATDTPLPTLPSTEALVSATFTVTSLPPTDTASPVPPTATPPACISLSYAEYAQLELIGPSGQRVLVDVHDPQKLSGPVGDRDVLLTTHTHWDHWNEEFQSAFPGLQLFVQTGMLEAPGAIIQGIASAHNQGDALKHEGGTNYIYLIEMGGLRIAHFGDIGQKALTEEQLAVLGQVDIAISQLHNPYSEMNAENAKGINLMMQLQPRLIIPTHLNLDATKLAVAQWPGFYTETLSLQICKSHLSQDETQFLLMGEVTGMMIRYVDLTEWGGP